MPPFMGSGSTTDCSADPPVTISVIPRDHGADSEAVTKGERLRCRRGIRVCCRRALLIYSQCHLTYALTEYVRHYDTRRPHRPLDQQPPLHDPVTATPIGPRVLHRERVLDGLPNEYTHRPAAA